MSRTKSAQYLCVSLAISATILYILTRLTTWQDFSALWHQLHWNWIAVSGLTYCAEIVLIGVRMSTLFATDRPPSGLTILVSNVHNFANKVLPARIGELAFPLLMRRYVGSSGTRAFSALILARLADFYTVMIAFSTVYILQRDTLSKWGLHWLPVALMWLTLLLVSTSLLKDGFWTQWLNRLEYVPVPRWVDRMRKFFLSLWRDLRVALRTGIRPGILTRVVLYSLLIWSSLYFVFIALGRAMRLNLTLEQCLIGASVAIFGTMLPVGGVGHFGGLEAGWTLGLLAVGASYSDAASSAIIVSVMTSFFALSIAIFSFAVLELRSRQVPKRLIHYPK